MATTHRRNPLPSGAPQPDRTPAISAAARTISAIVATIALSLVILLNPNAALVYAANILGSLRAPGEAGLVAAHRGDRSAAPENTLPAFEAAVAAGMPFIETDVQLTADGAAVLIHDLTVDRTTDGAGFVTDLTLAEIRSLDAGSWHSDEFAGLRVPVLGEFLDVLVRSGRSIALLELKGMWSESEVRVLLGDIFVRGIQDRVVFASFEFVTLVSARDAAPAIPRILIQRSLDAPLDRVTASGAIAVLTNAPALSSAPETVELMHAAGFAVLLYTLNSEQRWLEALILGVDGIVTDKPSKLDAWIARTTDGT